MNFKVDGMSKWEMEKAVCLIHYAQVKLNWDVTGYGECAVNQGSGYVYLWLEDYPVCLFLPISFDGEMDDAIYVQYTDLENGDEFEMRITQFKDMTEIYEWVESIEVLIEEQRED
jgi:hypothetical protein